MAHRLLPPGPRGHFLWGSVFEFLHDPLSLMLRCRERYGDVVRYRMGPTSLYQISHPDGVEHVLQTHHKKYHKGVFHKKVRFLAGEGLVSSEDDFWLCQRRLAQPAFHRQRLAALAESMTKAAQETAERWQGYLKSGQEFEVSDEMKRLTLQIVGQALLSIDLSTHNEELRHNFLVALQHIDYRMNNPLSFPEFILTNRNRRFRRALRELDTYVFSLISQRRRHGGDVGDLLSMLLLARDEDTGESMSDRQVRDEVMTILFAGHETSAMALTWMWHLLSQHPNVEDKLHSELDTVLAGRAAGFGDLSQLRYTQMVIEETLRLYPPAWGIARQSVDEDEIGGYRIPKGVQLMISTYATHRHPDFWEYPEEFDPERFTPEHAKSRPKFAYYPFGGGPRVCIGSNFALMEMQLILATLAQRYRLARVPGQLVEVQLMITMRPRYGMRMTLQDRV